MARQKSLIQFTGVIGNIIFYKTIDGYLARKKGGIAPHRIHTEPNFARTRENNAEFGRAAQGSKLIRRAFRSLLHETSDTRMTSRLNGALVNVIRADAINKRGERTVVDGDVSLLKAFDFNKNARLSKTFLVPFTTTIDRDAGTLAVDIPAFSPENMINAPEGATHFRLKIGGAALDFASQTYVVATSESSDLPLTEKLHGPMRLNLSLSPGNTHPLFLVLGIAFTQAVNEGQASLKNGSFNAMAVVSVER